MSVVLHKQWKITWKTKLPSFSRENKMFWTSQETSIRLEAVLNRRWSNDIEKSWDPEEALRLLTTHNTVRIAYCYYCCCWPIHFYWKTHYAIHNSEWPQNGDVNDTLCWLHPRSQLYTEQFHLVHYMHVINSGLLFSVHYCKLQSKVIFCTWFNRSILDWKIWQIKWPRILCLKKYPFILMVEQFTIFSFGTRYLQHTATWQCRP